MQRKFLKSVICLATWICIAGIAQTYAQQQGSEELRRRIRYAQTAYNRGEYSNALKEYQEALKLAPNYPELYKAIGDVYEKLLTAADLEAAIAHYQGYIKLAPKADDARQIQDRIYDLEYLLKERVKQDSILNDLSGEWVAVDNINVSMDDKGELRFTSDVIFRIAEIQKTGKYSVTMNPRGSRLYSAGLIEKTVHIELAKDNAFTFTFADATVYTPSAGKYNFFRTLGSIAATVSGEDWVSSLVDVATNVAQEQDLPSNAQTIYTFALKYDEGKLVGLVNIVNKYADPTRQQTTGNSTPAITLVKRDDNFPELLRAIFDDQLEIIDVKTLKDKWGNKLSKEEIYKRLYAFDQQLGKKYQKARTTEKVAIMTTFASIFALTAGVHMIINDPPWERKEITTGAIVSGTSLLSGIASAIVWHNASSSKQCRLINQYNNQITQQHNNKPVAELRFGITSSGGVGLALTF